MDIKNKTTKTLKSIHNSFFSKATAIDCTILEKEGMLQAMTESPKDDTRLYYRDI